MTPTPQQAPKEPCTRCTINDAINAILDDILDSMRDSCTETFDGDFVIQYGDVARNINIFRSRSHPAPAPDDTDLEELGNQDIDPKVFAAFANACAKGAEEQFLREHDVATARQAREEFAQGLIKYIKIAQLDSWTDGEIEKAINCCLKCEEGTQHPGQEG